MRFLVPILAIAALPMSAAAQTDLTYWQDIRPIFRSRCTACHSMKNVRELEVSGGLALDTFDATRKGAKRPAIVAGNADKSLLYELLITTDVKKRMPLDGEPVSKEKIALIKKWIDSGAKEGTPPLEVLAPIKKVPTRKLDVIIPTTTTPPAGSFGIKSAGKLELALKIGPLAPITAVAFSPDNQLLAAGSYGQVIVWDLAKAQPIKQLTNVLGAVNDLRFSPKGEVLAVGGGQPSAKGDLRVYQTSNWKLLGVLRGHDDTVMSISFSPDGSQLASASFDHSVRLWDVKTHATIKEYHHHSDFVYAVAFSPDGKRLVSASKDRTVQLFEKDTAKSLFTFGGMNDDVMAVAFHPDGKSVISSGFETGIFWWSTQTGEKIRIRTGHGVAVHELGFSKDGKRIVSAGADRTVRTWEGVEGVGVKIMPVGSVTYSAAISPNAKFIASGSFDGLVRLWDEASARHLVTLLAYAGDDQPDWLAMTPEGYATGSDKFVKDARWRMNGQEANATQAWSSLKLTALVAQAFRGEPVPAPVFDKK